MRKINLLLSLLFVAVFNANAKELKIEFNTFYDNIKVSKNEKVSCLLNLEKNQTYQFIVNQRGIDVFLVLSDEKTPKIIEKDSPNGKNGFELFEYTSSESKPFTLTIAQFEEETNSDEGVVSIFIKRISKDELTQRKKAQIIIEEEERRGFTTLDVVNFWEAFDQLKSCKTNWDSVITIQNLYYDRASKILSSFFLERKISPEDFVKVIARNPKFYQSVKPYSLQVLNANADYQSVISKLKEIYPNFTPFKICFAIGTMNTGGNTFNHNIFIGTELTMLGENVDFSEEPNYNAESRKNRKIDLPKRLRGIMSHESIHTQQIDTLDKNAISCDLLRYCLREGSANFLGELMTGTTNYTIVNEYGDKNEAALWKEFKEGLCSQDYSKWLYGSTTNGRPSDIGYYIGYKIVQSFYENAKDKNQAIKEIIEINDPIEFLQKSLYDLKKKN